MYNQERDELRGALLTGPLNGAEVISEPFLESTEGNYTCAPF